MTHKSNFYTDMIPHLDSVLAVEQNFDLIHRKLAIGGRDSTIYFIDGFVKDEVLQKLLQQFQSLKEKDMPDTVHELLDKFIPYFEVDLIREEAAILKHILSGVPCLFINGYDQGISIDCLTEWSQSIFISSTGSMP